MTPYPFNSALDETNNKNIEIIFVSLLGRSQCIDEERVQVPKHELGCISSHIVSIPQCSYAE